MERETIRNIKTDEYDSLLRLLDKAYGHFHSSPETLRQLSSKFFEPNGCFIAEEDNDRINGCIATTRLPRKRWFVLRYLAIENPAKNSHIATELIKRALNFVDTQHGEYLRSTTPLLEPYVDLYQQNGFYPARRDFRIIWKLEKLHGSSEKLLKFEQVTIQTLNLAAETFRQALEPYWTWRTKEQGGEESVVSLFKQNFEQGEQWKLALYQEKIIGLIGLIPNYIEKGKTRFRGAYVLPKYREKGFGMIIMQEAIHWALALGQENMVVYTYSPLDRFAPGASLYVKSGGKIDAEYLQLEKQS